MLLSVLPGRRYLSALFISSQIFIQATNPLHQAQGIMLCSLSFLPHSYLSFHSSASHFTYMFMQNHSSNLLDTWLQRLFQIKRTEQHQIFEWPGFAIWIYPAVELWPARLAHLETGRIVRVTLNEASLQQRQGAPSSSSSYHWYVTLPYPSPALSFAFISICLLVTYSYNLQHSALKPYRTTLRRNGDFKQKQRASLNARSRYVHDISFDSFLFSPSLAFPIVFFFVPPIRFLLC